MTHTCSQPHPQPRRPHHTQLCGVKWIRGKSGYCFSAHRSHLQSVVLRRLCGGGVVSRGRQGGASGVRHLQWTLFTCEVSLSVPTPRVARLSEGAGTGTLWDGTGCREGPGASHRCWEMFQVWHTMALVYLGLPHGGRWGVRGIFWAPEAPPWLRGTRFSCSSPSAEAPRCPSFSPDRLASVSLAVKRKERVGRRGDGGRWLCSAKPPGRLLPLTLVGCRCTPGVCCLCTQHVTICSAGGW